MGDLFKDPHLSVYILGDLESFAHSQLFTVVIEVLMQNFQIKRIFLNVFFS